MKMMFSKMKGIYLNYYVMFCADAPTEPYSPIINMPDKIQGELHGLDPDVIKVLPALWYCLHLPRNGFDTTSLSAEAVSVGYSVPHSILLTPSYIRYEEIQKGLIDRYPPTLVISDDACLESATELAVRSGAPLKTVRLSDLSTILLKEQWQQIEQMVQKLTHKYEPLQAEPELLQGHAKSALPLTFIANQFGVTDWLMDELQRYDFNNLRLMYHSLTMRSKLKAIVELELDRKKVKNADTLLSERVGYHQKTTQIPVVITLPGSAGRMRPKDGSHAESQEEMSAVDSSVELLGVHSAIARGGVYLKGSTLPTRLFKELHLLENHCKAYQKDNRYVWKSMRRIGDYFAEEFGSDGLKALHRASQLLVFSDFPLGLAILPGMEDPLCCVKPISYKTLTPLTRSLQLQLPRNNEHYIGRGFKVVIAECLSPNDRIRKQSDAAWKLLRDMFESDDRISVVYSEVRSIQFLKELLLSNHDADILIISAHGKYDTKRNLAGLVIGNSIWIAAEDDFRVPPVVILSACHVAPRGLGAVSVNDMLFRAGAQTVLGTLIPVDVTRNALLTIRLFTYILEAIVGRGKFRSLDEAWQHVVATNAVNEILASSKRLVEWAQKRPVGKPSPIEEFMKIRSTGCLRVGRVYSDTFTILNEMAKKDGISELIEAVRSSQGFFPESCFYVLNGAPERVILTEPVYEKFVEKGGFAE